MAEVPTLRELMDKYKTADVSRRVAQVILAGTNTAVPCGSPSVPSDRVRILREAYSRAPSRFAARGRGETV
jgi:hypothetical protein